MSSDQYQLIYCVDLDQALPAQGIEKDQHKPDSSLTIDTLPIKPDVIRLSVIEALKPI
jgi:hypothetical protein